MSTRELEVEFERRGFPRVRIELPIAVVHETGAVATATSHDLAPRGMQLRFSRETAERLNPSGRPLEEDPVSSLDLHFRVPLGSEWPKIDVRCTMVHWTPLVEGPADRCVALGVMFERFLDGSSDTLEAYLVEQMRPKDA